MSAACPHGRTAPRSGPGHRCRIYMDLELPKHRIVFLGADRSKVTAFAEAEEAEGEMMEVSCKPHFQLWKEKAMITHIDGANAPELAR